MDVFDLFAKISLDDSEFRTGLDSAGKQFKSFSDILSGGFSGAKDLFKPAVEGFQAVESVGGKVTDTVTTGLKAMAGTATAVAGGAAVIGKSAFDAYADYEQLVGGIETLFKENAGAVMQYADNAYKTAGMSANNYMETVTSFSASLLQGLGGDTETAAKIADLAITDMSDNANKMGTSMESIQYAYQGFAKQNYTMLDNLKLGYGGTQEEMARLVNESGVLGDSIEVTAKSVKDVPFDKIIEAIHVVQTEMGITGTTAKEASSTIQGSVSSMKGAWENFMVGIADGNQDLSGLMDNLIESVVTAGNNVVPRIQEIVDTVVRVAPEFVRGFAEVIPQFAEMGVDIVRTLAQGIGAQIPTLLEYGSKAIGAIADGIVQYAPRAAAAIGELITGIGDMIGSQSDKLVSAGTAIIDGIFSVFESASDVISKYIGDFVPLIADAFLSYHETLFTVGLDILAAIGEGIVENKDEIQSIASETIESMVTSLRENAPAIIEGGVALLEALAGAIVENLPLILETGAEIVTKLAESISEALPELIPAAVEAILKFVEGLTSPDSFSGLIGGALKVIEGLIEGLAKALPRLSAYAPEIVVNLVTGIIAALPKLLEVGAMLIKGLIEGLIQGIAAIPEAIAKVVTAIVDGFKALFGIHSPSTVFAEMGVNLIAGLLEGISGAWESILEFFSGAAEALISFLGDTWETIKTAASDAWGALKDTASSAWDGIKSVWSAAKGFFSDLWNNIKSNGQSAASAVGNALKKSWENIKSAWEGAGNFFKGILSTITSVFKGVGDKFKSIGGSIVSGLKNGVANAWNSFTSWISSKVGGLIDAVKNMLGIHSPSTVFAGIGENMALGLGEGWSNEYGAVKRQIEGGLNFRTATVDLSSNGLSRAPYGAPASNRGGDTFNFYSPKALDPVSAAREMKKAKQQMALGYVGG